MAREFDFVISGGTIYDGTGSPGFAADVGIVGDTIAAVGDLSSCEAGQRIDAAGMAVAPGFIDAHTHSDLAALLAPLAENRLFAGVTTEIGGNCGFAAGPISQEHKEQFLEHYEGLSIAWHTQGEFFEHLEKTGSAVNHAFLIGFGNIRRTAMGGDFNRPASAEETAKMRELIEAEIEAGAIGVSSGLIYPPGCFADKEEIAAAIAPLAGTSMPYASHIRSEGATLMESLDEALFIAETAGCPLHVSHLKVNGRSDWHKMPLLRDWWAAKTKRSVRVTADRYPYCAGHTGLDAIIPQWTYDGGPKAELERLRDEDTWQRIREEVLADTPGPERWDEIVVGTVQHLENKRFEGMRVSDVARDMGLEPVDAVRSLIISDETRTMAMYFSMKQENMREILSWDGVVVGSDSSVRALEGPSAIGFPHPRTFGTTGKMLRLFVREEGILDMSKAVHKMTGAVAEIFGIEKRGVLKEGNFADVVVFDPSTVSDKATYEQPSRQTVGIRETFVNGRLVMTDGKVTGEKPGRVL